MGLTCTIDIWHEGVNTSQFIPDTVQLIPYTVLPPQATPSTSTRDVIYDTPHTFSVLSAHPSDRPGNLNTH